MGLRGRNEIEGEKREGKGEERDLREKRGEAGKRGKGDGKRRNG